MRKDISLKVKVFTAGALTKSLPNGQDIIEGETITVQGLLERLVTKHGPLMAKELLHQGKLREGLVLLVNGMNVLSLPEKFDTLLKDGDEVLIAIIVAGG